MFMESDPRGMSLRCNFTEAFDVGRRMEILMQAAAELSSILRDDQIPCFIGVGPLDDQNMFSDQWEIVIIPVNANEQKNLVPTVHAFTHHLNAEPIHHLVDPPEAPASSNATKLPDPTLN